MRLFFSCAYFIFAYPWCTTLMDSLHHLHPLYLTFTFSMLTQLYELCVPLMTYKEPSWLLVRFFSLFETLLPRSLDRGLWWLEGVALCAGTICSDSGIYFRLQGNYRRSHLRQT
ncbi:uncharacterized protein C8R40DRAFT_613540 [Lentinula edodes]|uniref:uncharacterized protein n=1 Tax=Lentinula edodes TaxID=5353 RepID=UPI001E8EC70D|nr:uncharacterized protein C8R40DRAFT_613540 [Lentinula edodes]KAH7870881.1 hypothetical protein C8R40DRAFT_613540 [Lentinula edodes]